MVFVRNTADQPGESLPLGRGQAASRQRLDRHNAPLVAAARPAAGRGVRVPGRRSTTRSTAGCSVPPGFDPNKKYPVVFLIHGGPQGAWHDEWHKRWNYQMFAAPGYAVVAINPRGSTGYGQKFTDQISQDWTGRVYDDLMKGLDHRAREHTRSSTGRRSRPPAARTAASWSTGSAAIPTGSRP